MMKELGMTGTLVLAGGEEFGGRMREVDELALRAAGGVGAVIRVLPTAAAADDGHARAGRNALDWFAALGATDVAVVPVIDRASADDPAVVAALADADLVYLPGGSPAYLAQALVGSQCAAMLRQRYEAGAVLAGSSAGAMIFGEYVYHPETGRTIRGLCTLPNVCIVPHYDRYGQRWIARLRRTLPDAILLGIDERTAALVSGDLNRQTWSVAGQGCLTVYRGAIAARYVSGAQLRL
jgi:cyanophycinase